MLSRQIIHADLLLDKKNFPTKVSIYAKESQNMFWRPFLLASKLSKESCASVPEHFPDLEMEDASTRNGRYKSKNFGSTETLIINSNSLESRDAKRALLRLENIPIAGIYTLSLFVEKMSDSYHPDNLIVLCKLSFDFKEHQVTWENQPSLDFDQCIVSEARPTVGNPVCFKLARSFIGDSRKINAGLFIIPGIPENDFIRLNMIFSTRDRVFYDSKSGSISFFSKETPRNHFRPTLSYDELNCRPRHMPTSKFPVLLPEQRKTLLVVSTCNEIAYTLRMLTTLERSSDDFDVVFVDDHSEDDTVSVLRKRGYAVIEKDAPLGLTDSWNKGYELFVTGGYDFLLVANNDILVPSGSISKMQDLMRHYPFMAPSTTLSGAGHNPAQSLANICNLKSELEGAIDEPRNYQRIQNMADIMCNTGAAFETPHTSKFGELLS